jgi:PhnB protein
MAFNPYLNFDGNCREAMAFYADVFGATDLSIMGPEAAPPEAVADWPTDRVMHAQFSHAGGTLMGADLPPGMHAPQSGVSVYHEAPGVEAARALFDKLAVGGTVNMPFDRTFWSPGFGGVTDRFGTSWMITVAMQQP